MIRINLLPHREMRRERRKKDFLGYGVLAALVAGILAFTGGVYNQKQISAQEERNTFVQKKNEELDGQIKEIATLRSEIAALKARQKAVEDLQSDRTVPVHLLDELVKYTPEGVFFKEITQEGKKLSLNGLAQSNEKVSELLRNLQSKTPWMEKPELIEIKSSIFGQPNNGREGKSIFTFQLTTMVKASPTPGSELPKPVVQGPAGAVSAAPNMLPTQQIPTAPVAVAK